MKEKIQKKANNNQRTKLKEKGITLIALVVTIIILLILAGVAIATATGDNGLFRKAREATNMYKDAERDESTALGAAEEEIDKLLNPNGNGGGSGDGDEYAKGNTKVTVSDGSYYIPDGFKLAKDSGKTINEGIVVEDKNKNQWVWIPCYVDSGVGSDLAGAVKYDRYAFSSDPDFPWSQTKLIKEDGTPDLDGDESQKIIVGDDDSYYYHEARNSNDEESIRQFGGYYIGRYEAGDGTVTNLETPRFRTSSDEATNTVTIKKGQAPYSDVTYEQSVTLSDGIANANSYNINKMYTKLCSSYAWDTALMFIGEDYATNSDVGNYLHTTFTFTDITGEIGTKYGGSASECVYRLIPTGQTTSAKKIYDMGGNLDEYTSENTTHDSDHGNKPNVTRGGEFSDLGPAGIRSSRFGGSRTGFRPTLYLIL